MSSSGRSRNNVDTKLIGFPPRITMRGGNDIAIMQLSSGFGILAESRVAAELRMTRWLWSLMQA